MRRPESTRGEPEGPGAEPPEDEVAVLPIEDSIDLHGFAPADIPDVVESYIEAAAARGYREVRLIHGRGKGVQRARVQAVLARNPLVIDFRDSTAMRGGWGATIAWLKAPPAPALSQPEPDE